METDQQDSFRLYLDNWADRDDNDWADVDRSAWPSRERDWANPDRVVELLGIDKPDDMAESTDRSIVDPAPDS